MPVRAANISPRSEFSSYFDHPEVYSTLILRKSVNQSINLNIVDNHTNKDETWTGAKFILEINNSN